MERTTRLKNILKQAMTDKEIAAFFSYRLTNADVGLLKETAGVVFTKIPFKGFDCAVMNALWAALIQDHSKIPVAPVMGSLTFKDKFIFDCQSSIPMPTESMTKPGLWDGHCWLEFGGMIADISMGRTLINESVDQSFRNAWSTAIDGKGGLVIASATLFQSSEIQYIPKFVMQNQLINGLMAGAIPK